MHQIAHLAGKFIDHIRVGNVLALGAVRHQQMMTHQPGGHLGIPARQAMTLTEGDRLVGTQLRMVTAAALGDVMVEAGYVQHFRLGQAIEHLVGER